MLQSVKGDSRVEIGYGQNQIGYGQNQMAMDRIRLAMDRIKWLWTESDWLWTESNHDGHWIRVLQSVEDDRRVEIGYGQNQTMMVIGFV